MKICSIYNQYDKKKNPVGFLVYFEQDKSFFIELVENAKMEDVPLMFALYIGKNRFTIDSLWSKKWVQARIIPTDRQNLGQILRDNNLKYYDEYQLLLMAKGECSHDDFKVEELSAGDEQCKLVYKRMEQNIRDVMASDEAVIVFYRDGRTVKYTTDELSKKSEHQNYLKEHMMDVAMLPGGYGLTWNLVVNVSAIDLKNAGTVIDVSYEDFCRFAKNNIVNTAGACEILDCTRQNIDDLIKRERLEPVSTSARSKMFLRADIEELQW